MSHGITGQSSMGENTSMVGAADFRQRATLALDRLESAIETAAEATDVDVEVTRAGNVIEVEFEDGSKLIINSHEAAGEIWLAARSGGFHFRPRADDWFDSRGNRELVSALEAEFQAQAGVGIDLRAIVGASL